MTATFTTYNRDSEPREIKIVYFLHTEKADPRDEPPAYTDLTTYEIKGLYFGGHKLRATKETIQEATNLIENA